MIFRIRPHTFETNSSGSHNIILARESAWRSIGRDYLLIAASPGYPKFIPWQDSADGVYEVIQGIIQGYTREDFAREYSPDADFATNMQNILFNVGIRVYGSFEEYIRVLEANRYLLHRFVTMSDGYDMVLIIHYPEYGQTYTESMEIIDGIEEDLKDMWLLPAI